MKCNLDIRLGIAPVLLPILLSGEISLVKAFAIQLVFSCEDAAQQVLMSVCLSVCGQLVQNVPECIQNVPECM